MLAFRILSRVALVALGASALGAQAESLSAAATHAALARGALAWDVRSAPAAVIPGAVQAAPGDVQRWLEGQGAQWLEQAVSAAGIDLSRDVVLYGAAGDPQAQALHQRLTRLASGRVHWLVGGIDEWQAAGLPTAAQTTRRLPVPQRLVPHAQVEGGQSASEMAAPGLRRSDVSPPERSVAAVSLPG
ncbi:MAG: rhodanese-like domain-containing protein [Pseudomonadota bacterium]